MNSLPNVDTRQGTMFPAPLLEDMAREAQFHSERYGHQAITVPSAALPVSFTYDTTTRTDPNAMYLTGAVLNTITVGPLPEAYGVNNSGP